MGYTHGTSIDSETRVCTKCNKELPIQMNIFVTQTRKQADWNRFAKNVRK